MAMEATSAKWTATSSTSRALLCCDAEDADMNNAYDDDDLDLFWTTVPI